MPSKCQKYKYISDKWYKIPIWLLFVFSVYAILAVEFYPVIRIHCDWCSCCFCNFNNLVSHFAQAYISAFLFFVLTIRLKEYIHHSKCAWLIHDVLNDLNNSIRSLLEYVEVDKRVDYKDIENVLSNFKEDDMAFVKTQIAEIENRIVDLVSRQYSWNEKELDLLYRIKDVCRIVGENIGYGEGANAEIIYSAIEKLYKLSLNIDSLTSKLVTK